MQKLNRQKFFKLSKKAHHIMFITIQYVTIRVTQFAFELLALNAKIKGVSSSCNVAMVSYHGIKSTITGSRVTGSLRNTNIVESLDKE